MTAKALAAAVAFLTFTSSPALSQEVCPPFRWTTLGTAAGPVPTAERGEPANLLDAGDQAILVDTGDGTTNQLARIGRDVGEVHSIFLSHLHWDHTGGLAAVLGLRWMNTFPGTITVFGPPGTEIVVNAIISALAPPSRIGFGTGANVADPAGNITVVEMRDGDRITLAGLKVIAAANTHFDLGEEATGTTSLSYRFVFGNRSITYTGDTGPSSAVTKLAQGSDLLVSEVIALDPLLEEIAHRRPDMSTQRKAAMRQHLSTHHIDAPEVGRIAATAGVGHVVMTHFAVPGPLRSSENYLRNGARQYYDGPLDLARDLSSFDVGCKDHALLPDAPTSAEAF